jgi:hypothetical protein
MLFVGFCLKRYGMTDDRFIHVSSAIVFKVALPISIFHSTVSATSDFLLDYEAWRFVLSACGFSGLVFLFSFIFAKSQNWDFGTKGAFVQGAFRSNYVIIGYPILLSLFDDGVVIKMSLLTLFVIPFFNVLSVFVLAYFDKTNTQLNFKKTMLEVIKNPLIISIVLGMGFKSLHLALPNFLDSSLRSIAGLATPLALINIGAMFGNSLEFKNKLPLFLATAIKTFISPLIFTVVAVLMGFRGYALGIIFVLLTAPTATVSFIMAKAMNSNDSLSANIVILTTVSSFLSIFLGISALSYFSLI